MTTISLRTNLDCSKNVHLLRWDFNLLWILIRNIITFQFVYKIVCIQVCLEWSGDLGVSFVHKNKVLKLHFVQTTIISDGFHYPSLFWIWRIFHFSLFFSSEVVLLILMYFLKSHSLQIFFLVLRWCVYFKFLNMFNLFLLKIIKNGFNILIYKMRIK